MTDYAAAFIVGLLAMIVYALAHIDGRLRNIGDELKRTREDNSAWRENVWNRDR